jgi:hypothetical protein
MRGGSARSACGTGSQQGTGRREHTAVQPLEPRRLAPGNEQRGPAREPERRTDRQDHGHTRCGSARPRITATVRPRDRARRRSEEQRDSTALHRSGRDLTPDDRIVERLASSEREGGTHRPSDVEGADRQQRERGAPRARRCSGRRGSSSPGSGVLAQGPALSHSRIGRGTPGATVRARMPRVARSADSGMIGKMSRSRHTGSIFDQS